MNHYKFFCPIQKKWFSRSISCCRLKFSGLDKVTVITATLGDRQGVLNCFLSLQNQYYDKNKIEWVIVESRDSSNLSSILSKIDADFHIIHLTEVDEGIYDAFNKGIELSSGSFISFLNDDDRYLNNFIVDSVNFINSTDAHFSFGDSIMIAENKHFLPASPLYNYSYFTNFTRFQHTTVLLRKSAFYKVGNFKEFLIFFGVKIKLKYASDYDFFSRCCDAGIFGIYNPTILGQIKVGRSGTHFIRTHLEVILILCKNENLTLFQKIFYSLIWFGKIIDSILLLQKFFYFRKIGLYFINVYKNIYLRLFN
jgi:glycosyltransferase involved in cell wall biosynthesis